MNLPNLRSVALPVHEIMAIKVWGGCEPQSWEEEALGGRTVGM